MCDIEKWRQWKSQHPEYPLTVGSNGQWRKMVLGRYHYFGPLNRPKRALAVWNGEKDYLLAGEQPPVSGGLTIADLADQFQEAFEARNLAVDYQRDLRFAVQFLKTHVRSSRPVAELTPTHFAALRKDVADSGRMLRSQLNLIKYIRAVFVWGADMQLHPPIKFGPEFKMPGREAIDRERIAKGRNRFIDRKDLLRLLHYASPAMQCMILLGVNCGFYPEDSVRITFPYLHLDAPVPYHDFPRVKNGRRRLAVLWPETVKRLRRYIHDHRGDNPSEYVMLAQHGRPYGDRSSALRRTFTNLLQAASVKVSPGTSIGSLRHTYGTVVDLSPDQQSIDLSMGHAPQKLQKRVYSQLNLGEIDRLARLATIVHNWLFQGQL